MRIYIFSVDELCQMRILVTNNKQRANNVLFCDSMSQSVNECVKVCVLGTDGTIK